MHFFMLGHCHQCTKENKIPDQVLIDILRIYEFGREEDLILLKETMGEVGNLVCMRSGDFWTTWGRIFEIRQHNQSFKKDAAKDSRTS